MKSQSSLGGRGTAVVRRWWMRTAFPWGKGDRRRKTVVDEGLKETKRLIAPQEICSGGSSKPLKRQYSSQVMPRCLRMSVQTPSKLAFTS